jgi:pentafunctional AROM polypeptide
MSYSKIINGNVTILVGFNILNVLPSELKTQVPSSRYVLISDETVYRLYGQTISEEFKNQNLELFIKVIPPGEESKTRETKQEIEDWMLSLPCTRDTCVLGI